MWRRNYADSTAARGTRVVRDNIILYIVHNFLCFLINFFFPYKFFHRDDIRQVISKYFSNLTMTVID